MTVRTVGAAGAAGTFDYTCDGTNDHAEIVAAIAAVGAGGVVRLSAGTFVCGDTIYITAGVSLIGTTGTVLAFPEGVACQVRAMGSQTISDLRLTGAVMVTVQGSNVACSRLVSEQVGIHVGAFRVIPISGTVEDALFEDCQALGTTGSGFVVDGTAPEALPDETWIRNLTFLRCSAIGCGISADRLSEYVCGFLLNESHNIGFSNENCAVIDCYAEGNYRSGFYCEGGGTLVGCTITRCASVENGRASSGSPIGSGFVCVPGWTLEDCTATGNRAGFYFGKAPYGDADPVRLIRCQAIGNVQSGITIQAQYGGAFENVQIADCIVQGCATPWYPLWLQNVIGGIVTDLRLIDCTGVVLVDGALSSGNVITYYLEPFAVATAAPVTGETVAFVDHSAGPAAWEWDFGDGSGSAAQHPTHAYAAPGRYVVTLAAGGTSVSMTVTVGCEPRTPGYYKQRAPNMHRMVNNARKLV